MTDWFVPRSAIFSDNFQAVAVPIGPPPMTMWSTYVVGVGFCEVEKLRRPVEKSSVRLPLKCLNREDPMTLEEGKQCFML